jgi:hypothetical protein
MESPSDCPYGFRIVGDTHQSRRLVSAPKAWAAHLACDAKAEVNREAYLSAFDFGADFKTWLDTYATTKGFDGVCGARFLWWDIDREGNLDAALRDTAKLVLGMGDGLAIAEPEDMLIFFSGSKGFHVGVPTLLWKPEPSATFHRVARLFAEHVAQAVGITIDAGVYDKVRAFRAPNSTHPKTGLHKIILPADFWQMSTDQIVKLAASPLPTECEPTTRTSATAAKLWDKCRQHVDQQAQAKALRSTAGPPTALNRATLDFIRDGAGEGDRHRLLFSAAANLAEFACPPALAHALLTEAALDSGLAPKEAHRQIECGLNATATAPASTPEGVNHAA